MRALIILVIGSWLAVGADLIAPAQAEEAPVYVNAEIVRVNDGARTLVYRDGKGEKTAAVDSAILPDLAKLQRGDKVILTSRVVRSDAGETRFVTGVRRTTPSAGTPETGKERTLSPLRVMNTDPGARMVTVVDEAGVTQVLAVRGEGVRELSRLKPGDTVVLSLGPEPGVKAGGDVVVRIRTVEPTATAPPSGSGSGVQPGDPIVIAPNPPANPGGGIPVERVTESIPSLPPPPTAAVVVPRPAVPATAVVNVSEAALRSFETSAAGLAVQAGYLERDFSAFRETCLREPGPSPSARPDWARLFDGSILPQGDDACRQTHEQLVSRAQKFKADLAEVTQEARRAGVQPGQIREVLQRHNMDI